MKMSMSEAGKLGWEKSRETQLEQKRKRIEEYYKNPLVCYNCTNIIAYQKYTIRNKKEKEKDRAYCSRSCSAKQNNIRYPKRININKKYCVKCNIKINGNNTVCLKCKPIIDKENFIANNHNFSSEKIRRLLLQIYGNKCMIKECGWDWTKPSIVEVDHINGLSEDNRIENLRLICPNCHSQTPTYKAKNIGNGRHIRRQRYKDGKSY